MTKVRLGLISKDAASSHYYPFLDDLKLEVIIRLIKRFGDKFLSSVIISPWDSTMMSKLEIAHKVSYMSEEEILNIFYKGNYELIEHVLLFNTVKR